MEHSKNLKEKLNNVDMKNVNILKVEIYSTHVYHFLTHSNHVPLESDDSHKRMFKF